MVLVSLGCNSKPIQLTLGDEESDHMGCFSARPMAPENLLPIGAKRSIRQMQITERKDMPRQEDISWKVIGSKPGAG